MQTNVYTSHSQGASRVAPTPNGGFIAVWASYSGCCTEPIDPSIRARRLGPSATPIGDELTVSNYTSEDQLAPAVAVGPDGSFVVVWQNGRHGYGGEDGSNINLRRYSSDGSALTEVLQVNAYTTLEQISPDVGVDGAGGFVVVWSDFEAPADESSGRSVHGQRYGSDGMAIAGRFRVNSYTTSWQYEPSLGVRPNGEFVVAWRSFGSLGSDDSWSIQARRFGSDGLPIGLDMQVNSYTSWEQAYPDVAVADDGAFLVVWTSFWDSTGSDTDGDSIQGKLFDASGTAIGVQFQVNVLTSSFQRKPRVSYGGPRDFVVSWESMAPFNVVSGYDIRARRFKQPVFADGFESGSTLRWSLAAP